MRRRVQRLTLDGNGEELWERRCREVREEMDEALEVCREADCGVLWFQSPLQTLASGEAVLSCSSSSAVPMLSPTLTARPSAGG